MTALRWIKENVEAIAIAVVMALVIRQFAIEAFKIPTGSMSPTLFGDTVRGPGDRILVDKVGTLFRDPDRYDVVVFKFPLNEAKNYIKRIVGFGGEEILIHDGDILIGGKVARKPPHVQDVLFFKVYPPEVKVTYGRGKGEPRWEAVDEERPIERMGEARYRLRSESGECLAAFVHPEGSVKDARPWLVPPEGGQDTVGDLKIEFEVTPESGSGGSVLVEITDNRIVNELVLAVGDGRSFFRHGDDDPVDLEGVVLTPGETVEVSFANVDDALYVEVDGDEFELFYDRPEDVDHDRDGVRFGVKGSAAEFASLTLFRDLYYVENPRLPVVIPEGHFFALGDNSRTSKDSRVWTLEYFELADGSVYAWDQGDRDEESRKRVDHRTDRISFQDIEGIQRSFKRSDIVSEWTRPAPFVPRDDLIGRAFFVFWPLNPFDHKFRIKFIR